MFTEAAQQSIPIQFVALRVEQVSDIGAIVTLALHDEGFLPDRFLNRTKFYRPAENFSLRRSFKPAFVNLAEPVAGVEDDVDELSAVVIIGLAEPVRERDFSPEAAAVKRRQRALEIALH